jgi:hypothetical protein
MSSVVENLRFLALLKFFEVRQPRNSLMPCSTRLCVNPIIFHVWQSAIIIEEIRNDNHLKHHKALLVYKIQQLRFLYMCVRHIQYECVISYVCTPYKRTYILYIRKLHLYFFMTIILTICKALNPRFFDMSLLYGG